MSDSKSARRSLAWLVLVTATALAHIVVLSSNRKTSLMSNAIQLFCAFLTIVISTRRAYQTADAYFRRAWLQLAAAFTIWFAAQAYYCFSLVSEGSPPIFPSPADFLWLSFAFPILLVTVQPRTGNRWEWVGWLDPVQSCVFFALLYVLVFSHPAVITVTGAYDFQSIALLLACALRYSSTAPGAERAFFRNLGGYLTAYGFFSAVGNRMANKAWVDLCWSMPPLVFCLIVVLTPERRVHESYVDLSRKIGLPSHLRGLSALGLTLLSVTAAALLEGQRHAVGMFALSGSLTLFAIRTSARESQLNAAHEDLQHAAHHDLLTGLANRTFLLEELSFRLEQSQGHQPEVCVLVLNLDGFKSINDSLGHPFGDRLLIEIASILSSSVPLTDRVVRLGDDEFVVLTDCGSRTPQQLATALVQQLQEPILLEGRVLYISVSVGIATVVPGQSAEDVLRDAGCAMYEAKKLGKNQILTFREAMVTKVTKQLAFEQDLRQAIADDRLGCYYQPIYSVSARRIVGFEALSRWQHPVRGNVPPAEFIPVAEETGLIIELGRRVLHQACYQVQQWNQLYDCAFTVSVNLSARQFADRELLSSIYDVFARTKLDPTLLKLEVTESALLSGVESVGEVLNAARALGVQIALDDFGTGYSSLAYLLRFPFDVIKIDRSFVQSIDQDASRAELVRTILLLARALKKEVIAEGVETVGELEWLMDMNCDLLQGYYFCKPLPVDEIQNLLHAQSRKRIGSRTYGEFGFLEKASAAEIVGVSEV
jgi:diguanylate cyclase (GGDEF)-like protein